MERKGFPESYDLPALLGFLTDVKSGRPHVTAPVYSHLVYDVVPGETVTIEEPDILIVEGLNVLQTRSPPKDAKAIPFVSDFFDFSIYIDADETVIHRWYIERFMRLKTTRFRDPRSYFHGYAEVLRGGGAAHRRGPLAAHQPRQFARQHPADPAARRPHPRQGREPRDRERLAAQALTSPPSEGSRCVPRRPSTA